MEALSTTLHDTENLDSPVTDAPEPFPQAWVEQGLLVGEKGRPYRPDGTFASRAEVGRYLISLIMAQAPAEPMLGKPKEPTIEGRLKASRSATPPELADPTFYERAARGRSLGDRTGFDLFGANDAAASGSQGARPPVIDLNRPWKSDRHAARTAGRRSLDALRE